MDHNKGVRGCTFEESNFKIWRPYGLCFAFQGLPALATGDNRVTVGVAFVTRREDVVGVIEVGHG